MRAAVVAEKLARDGYNLLIGAVPSSISLAIIQNLDRWDAAYFVQASKSDKITTDSCKARGIRTNHSDAIGHRHDQGVGQDPQGATALPPWVRTTSGAVTRPSRSRRLWNPKAKKCR